MTDTTTNDEPTNTEQLDDEPAPAMLAAIKALVQEANLPKHEAPDRLVCRGRSY